jgi:CheY-like chemotaxis protein
MPGQPAAILVVDDDPGPQQFLQAVLEQHGYAVLLAATGDQALEVFQRHQATIRLVLLDVHLPGRDGPATLEALRALDPQVRCCFMSSNPGSYSPEDLQRRGALAYFPKPFDLPQLLQVVGQAVGPPTP